MMSPDSSSELDRMQGFGKSVCTTTFGLRGSETSTAVKFLGALSCASQMMRLPSLATCTDMPSPIPPKPPRSFCASSLKFQVVGSALFLSGLVAVDIRVSVADCEDGFKSSNETKRRDLLFVMAGTSPAMTVVSERNRSGAGLFEEFGAQRLAPVRDRLDFVFL